MSVLLSLASTLRTRRNSNRKSESSEKTDVKGVKSIRAALLLSLTFTSVPLPAIADDPVYVWCLYQGRTDAYPGPNGLAAVFSSVFRMNASDYRRYTNDEANSFESYVDAHFDFSGSTTVTCHPSDSYQEAADERNSEIADFRRSEDYAIYTAPWAYHGR